MKGFLQNHSAFYLAVAERFNLFRLHRGASNPLLASVLTTSEEEWTSTERVLTMLADLCRAQGITLVVTYVPLDVEVQSSREADGRFASDRIEAMCRAHQIIFVDSVRVLRSHPADALFVDDAHPTAAGHRVLGEAIGAALLRLVAPAQSGMIPVSPVHSPDRQGAATWREYL